MTTITIIPGEVPLSDWRAIYRGAGVALDPSALTKVAESAAAVERILARHEPVYGINTGFGKLASVRIGDEDLETLQRNIVLSHAAGVGDPMPRAIARLMMALKLASLSQGASGVRPATITLLEAMIARDLIPDIPCQGSVGASGDLAPLSHLAAAMIGVGVIKGQDARGALRDAGLAPLTLGPKEGLALLNGTQFSTANALAGLFEAERLFQSALITGALSVEAAKGSDAPFDPRIHALRRHKGQIEVAAALRDLMAGSAIRASHAVDDPRVQDPYCLRCQPQVMGAALDLLRQAAATLGTEANCVSDNPLIFTGQDGAPDEALSGGNFHAEPVAFAADMIALAICEIGSISERRIAMLVDPALSGLPAFLTPHPGLNSGFMIPQVTAAALVSENKQRAYPASVDSIPTSANQEDHVSMAAHGARRLMDMAANLGHVIGIEYLAACQGCDFHAPLPSSVVLESARALLRDQVPALEEDRHFHPDLMAASALVTGGGVAALADLPGVVA